MSIRQNRVTAFHRKCSSLGTVLMKKWKLHWHFMPLPSKGPRKQTTYDCKNVGGRGELIHYRREPAWVQPTWKPVQVEGPQNAKNRSSMWSSSTTPEDSAHHSDPRALCMSCQCSQQSSYGVSHSITNTHMCRRTWPKHTGEYHSAREQIIFFFSELPCQLKKARLTEACLS